MSTTEHRRVHERFACELPVQILQDGRELSGTTVNISLGGMFIHMAEPLAFGTTAKVRVRLPALKEDAEIPVTVRWRTEEGVGLQFGSLRALEVWAINQLFKK